MSEPIQVMVRVRPPAVGKVERRCFAVDDGATEGSFQGPHGERRFTFDRLFDSHVTQEDVYSTIGETTVDHVLKGYNATVLAYGQTGSGKTHSMFGPDGGSLQALDRNSPLYDQRGLIPRMFDRLFNVVARRPAAEVSCRVVMVAFELYREVIVDLLSPNAALDYRIREDSVVGGRGVYVENLRECEVTSLPEAFQVLQQCAQRRHVASTKANDTSSRSHSVVIVTVDQRSHVEEGTRLRANLNLVDLAGSEKVEKTGVEGDQLKEAQTINLSLTLLGNVIYKLTDGRSVHIPYRDSKLTRILQDSLGGNTRTTLLCNCSAAASNRNETLSTLQFASRAKQIQNKPRVNKEMNVHELTIAYAKAQEEIRMLKDRLSLAQAGGGSGGVTIPPKATGSPREHDTSSTEDLQGTIQSLLKELEEVKGDHFEKTREVCRLQQQVDFYRRQKAAESIRDQQQQERQQIKPRSQRLAEVTAAREQSSNPVSPARRGSDLRRSGSQGRNSRSMDPPPPPPPSSSRGGVRRTSSVGVRNPSSGSRTPKDSTRGGRGVKPRTLPPGPQLPAMDPSALAARDSLRGLPFPSSARSSLGSSPSSSSSSSDRNLPLAPPTPSTPAFPSTVATPPPQRSDEVSTLRAEMAQTLLKQHDLESSVDDLQHDLKSAREQLQHWKQNCADEVRRGAKLQAEAEKLASGIDMLERVGEHHRQEMLSKDREIAELKNQLKGAAANMKAQEAQQRDALAEEEKRRKQLHNDLSKESGQKSFVDTLAMELLVKTEELLEMENDIYMMESVPMPDEERTVLRGNLEANLRASEKYASEMSTVLKEEVFSEATARHKQTLQHQLTDLSERSAALARRLDNPLRSGNRRRLGL